MKIICPECNYSVNYSLPIKDNRLFCKQCKSIFLTPVKAMQQPETVDILLQEKKIKKEFITKKEALHKEYKNLKKQLKNEKTQLKKLKKQSKIKNARSPVKTTISKRILVHIITIYVIFVFMVNTILMIYQYQEAKKQILIDLKTSELIFGKGIADALWNYEEMLLKSIISGILKQPIVVGVKIINNQNENVGAAGIFQNKNGSFVNISDMVKVFSEKINESEKKHLLRNSDYFYCEFPLTKIEEGTVEKLGVAYIYSQKKLIFDRVKAGYGIILFNSIIIAIALIVTLLWVCKKLLSNPLSMLTNEVSQINLKNLDTIEINIPNSDTNEIKVLVNSFNRMIHKIMNEQKANMEITKTFEKFIPKQVLSKIADKGIRLISLGGMSSERLTVLYCKLNISQQKDTQVLNDRLYHFLNDYLSLIEVPVEKHGGFFYKFDTKEIIILFDLNDHKIEALSSIYAAIEIQKVTQLFNQRNVEKDKPRLSVSIGIDSGLMQLGTLGSNNRMESTVIGEAIDTAVQLQELTAKFNCQIIISYNTYSLSHHFLSYKSREINQKVIKNNNKPESFYEIFDADPVCHLKDQIIEDYNKGYYYYCEQNWIEAIKYFKKCLKTYHLDAISKIHLKTCEKFLSKESVFHFLKNNNIFSKIQDNNYIESIARVLKKELYKTGEVVLRQGEKGSHFFIIYDGYVEVIINKEGNDIKITELQNGNYFGEMSILSDEPANATITCTRESVIFVMEKEDFKKLIKTYPKLTVLFYKSYAEYTIEATELLR